MAYHSDNDFDFLEDISSSDKEITQMARTESKSIQVHPSDEQSQIDLMQKFHWNLQSSQEINTKDSHLEKRGDKIYSVTTTNCYVKLVFTRDLNYPNLDKVKKLENEYFSISFPSAIDQPGLVAPIFVPGVGGLILAGVFEKGVGILLFILCIVGSIFWFKHNIQKRKEVDQKNDEIRKICRGKKNRKEELLLECSQI